MYARDPSGTAGESPIFQRSTSLPNEEAVLLLLFGLLRSGQITLRRVVGWRDLILQKEPPKAAA